MYKSASRSLWLLVLLALFWLVSPAAALAEAFDIGDYDVEVVVNADYTYDITETLQVDFTEPRHGIYRDIPLNFADRSVRIRDIRVTGGDADIDRSSDAVSIRIGDPDVTVEGRVPYQIRYTLVMGPDGDEDRDLFYLNLIGTMWDTTIHNASFQVDMPHPFAFEDLNLTRGPLGSEDTSGITFEETENGFSGAITRPLGPREGLSAYLELPEGYFDAVRGPALWPPYAVLALGLLLVFLSYRIWRKKGVDEMVVVTPEFYAPDDLTPAEIGYVVDRVVSPLDVTSLILYWGERGHLELEEDGKRDFILYKKRELPADAQSFETYFFKALFDKGDGQKVSTKALSKHFYTEMQTAQGMVKSSFADHADRRLTRRESAVWRALLVLVSAVPLWGMAAYAIYLANGGYISLAALFLSVLTTLVPVAGIAMFANGWINRRTAPKGRTAGLLFGGGLILAVSALVAWIALPLPFGLIALALSIVIGFVAQATEQRTPFGTRILGQVLGFKQFLNTAERDRIERLLDDNPQYFYDVLPYAQVLGVTKKWARKFEGLSMEPPTYYRSYHGGAFSAYAFATAMDRSFRSAASDLAVNPNANSGGSGSGGGGFSGGGAGGGGGGSW